MYNYNDCECKTIIEKTDIDNLLLLLYNMSNNINFDIIDDEDAEKSLNIEKNVTPFQTSLTEYLSKNKPVVYLLTPCFASLCYVNYVHCLMATVELFRKYNIELNIEFCRNDSLVSRARNNLVARAMANPKMTHIIFIDNDISWDPQDILKLIISDKNIVGGIYPLKNYNWSQLLADKKNPTNPNVIGEWIKRKNASQFKDIISDESMIQYNLVRYNVNYLNNTLNIEKNLAKVKHIATGFMMIKRSVIEKMSKAFPSTKYVDDVNFLRPEENEFAYALFDCGVEEGHYFSEDWLFCHRWTKMGGSIWMDVSISLTHTGIEDYRGCYITSVLN
jgi:acyl-CoA synthetase (AMP-forming)/AMP-acid ligase II